MKDREKTNVHTQQCWKLIENNITFMLWCKGFA